MRQWAGDAHVFFWLVLVSLVPAAVVGCAVEGRSPTWSLKTVAIYRIEVGLAVYLALYFVALVVCNAYKGQAVGRIHGPGFGMTPKDPDDPLAEASAGAEDFQETTRKNFEDFNQALEALSGAVGDVESRKLGERVVKLEDVQAGERLRKLEELQIEPRLKGLEGN